MSINEKIVSLRKKEGITQEQLAEQLGVTRQTISKWELGQSTPEISYISQLSDLFHVSTDYLIKEKEAPIPQKVVQSSPVEMISSPSRISSLQIMGIIFACLGGVLLVVGIIMCSFGSDCSLAIILGALLLILGLEYIIVKKHPVLVGFWTLWLFFLPFTTIMWIKKGGSSGASFSTIADIFSMLHLFLFIVLIIATVLSCRRSKKKLR